MLPALPCCHSFNDIFDSALPVNNTCPAGYKMISKRDNRVGATCLLLKVRSLH